MADPTDPKPSFKFNKEQFRRQLPRIAADLMELMDKALTALTEEEIEQGTTCGAEIGLVTPGGERLRITMYLRHVTPEEIAAEEAEEKKEADHGKSR